jgi:carboxymethylenebutenolidase
MIAPAELPSDILGLTAAPFLSRRGFMSASAATAAGFTLAAGPVRAEPIHTDAIGLATGEARIAVEGADMPAYFARPAHIAKPPVVLVAMEVFGLHEYIRDICRRLAKLGAFAVAPDYYFRSGDMTKITDIQQLLPLVNAKADAELMRDLDATAAWAGSRGGDAARLAIVGFCRGGRAVWRSAAHHAGLKAGVAFYGTLVDPPALKAHLPKSPLDLAAEIRAPVLGLYGEADQGIPVSQVEDMRARLKAAGKTSEIRLFPGAPHAFHADYRPSYRPEAAAAAWTEMSAWLKTHGVLA